MTTAPLRAICRRARSPKSKSDRHLHPAVHARIDNGPSRDRRCDPQVLPRDRPTAQVAHGLGVPRDVTCRLSSIGGRRRELVAQGSALLEPIGSTHHQIGNQRFDVFDSGRPDPVFMTHDRGSVCRTELVGWGVLTLPRFLRPIGDGHLDTAAVLSSMSPSGPCRRTPRQIRFMAGRVRTTEWQRRHSDRKHWRVTGRALTSRARGFPLPTKPDGSWC